MQEAFKHLEGRWIKASDDTVGLPEDVRFLFAQSEALVQYSQHLLENMNVLNESRLVEIDIARSEYQQAAMACLVLLDRDKRNDITSRDSAEIVRVITVCTQCAKHYHVLLWEVVLAFGNKELDQAMLMERRAVLDELQRFELEHHQLAARLDRLIIAQQKTNRF